MILAFFYFALSIIWLIEGLGLCLFGNNPWLLIAGIVYFALVIVLMVSLIIRRKRYPIEEAETDRQAVGTSKDRTIGMGIVMGIITIGVLGFLVASSYMGMRLLP